MILSACQAMRLYKYPHEFSGGQRQRIGVARAMATNPKLIIADEPVSALDLSVQAQVLNFMKRIQEEYNISYLFISHDLGVVKHMCKKMAIMHRGRFVEIGTRKTFISTRNIFIPSVFCQPFRMLILMIVRKTRNIAGKWNAFSKKKNLNIIPKKAAFWISRRFPIHITLRCQIHP